MSIADRWSGRARSSRPAQPAPNADEDLVRELYQEHGRSLLAYATRLTGDRAAAEDVVQETLIRAWKNADKMVAERGSVRGWLLTVARNIVTDRARARSARPSEVEQTFTTVPVERDRAPDVLDTIVVMDALDQLSPEHRDVLVELYYNGRSMREVALKLGIPPGTVKSRSYYALRAMNAIMGGETRAGA